MSLHFNLAPLVELVAEVRWQIDTPEPLVTADSGPISLAIQGSSSSDEFLTRFLVAADRLGYRNTERMFPPGVAPFPGQPAMRLRKSLTDPILLQVGLGVLTVNALPPYQTWDAFAPTVRDALSALIEARGEAAETYISALVRYIDVFDQRFTRGASPADFIKDTLGFSIRSKEAVSSKRDSSKPEQLAFQLAFETENDLRVQVNVAEGQVGAARGVVLDTTVGRFRSMSASADDVFATMDAAHTVIHDMFVELSSDLSDIMQPVNAEAPSHDES